MDEGGGYPPGSKMCRSNDSNKKINEYFKHQQQQQHASSSPLRHSERHSSGTKSPLPNKMLSIVSANVCKKMVRNLIYATEVTVLRLLVIIQLLNDLLLVK